MTFDFPAPETGIWTAYLCRGDFCQPDHELLMSALRAVVRASPQAVLISTRCLLGPAACAMAPEHKRAKGSFLFVQPCGADRIPTGPVVPLGPLETPEDIHAVCDWLRRGPAPTRIPQRLLIGLRPPPRPDQGGSRQLR